MVTVCYTVCPPSPMHSHGALDPWLQSKQGKGKHNDEKSFHVDCWGQGPAKIEEFTLLRSFHGNL